MAFVCVDKDGEEKIIQFKPIRDCSYWWGQNPIPLPQGTIKKLIGRDLSFDDDPVELT